jgi:hypothetical protein
MSGVSSGTLSCGEDVSHLKAMREVIQLIAKKAFVEPAITKYEQSLDEVTLHLNCYDTHSSGGGRRRRDRGKHKGKH